MKSDPLGERFVRRYCAAQRLIRYLESVEPRIKTVCAWCPDKIEREREATARDSVVSHGICESCREEIERGFTGGGLT